MCGPASLVLSQTSEFWLPFADSHETIISTFGLYDGISRDKPLLLRLEVSPSSGNWKSYPKHWKVKYDAPAFLPAWCSEWAEYDKQPVWQHPLGARLLPVLKKWQACRVGQRSDRLVMRGGFYWTYDKSQGTGTGSLRAFHDSTFSAHDSNVMLFDSSSGDIYGGIAENHGFGSVHVYDGGEAFIKSGRGVAHLKGCVVADGATAKIEVYCGGIAKVVRCESALVKPLGLIRQALGIERAEGRVTLEDFSSVLLYFGSTKCYCLTGPQIVDLAKITQKQVELADREGRLNNVQGTPYVAGASNA